jgi:hypothetical protein
VTTSGDQTYTTAVVLGADTTFTGNLGTFASGIAGENHAFTINFTGARGVQPPPTLRLRKFFSDVSLAGNFSTNLDQFYNANVTLTGDTTLTGNARHICQQASPAVTTR